MRKALLIGIDEYSHFRKLKSCVADAEAINKMLRNNEDRSSNYACKLITCGDEPVTRSTLRIEVQNLFQDDCDGALFYFSGHGVPSKTGGYLVTQDGVSTDPGIPMSEVIDRANGSIIKEIVIILDCCFAGDMADIPISNYPGASPYTQLRQGVTVLGSSGRNQLSREMDEGHGVFTSLILGALSGGGADVRGRISAASIYGYVEQALGPWDQRPIYKSYSTTLLPIRRCKPPVPDDLLRDLTVHFPTPNSQHEMDPSYEFTHKSMTPANVEIFNKFKCYRNAGLLRTVKGDDLYFAALDSNAVELTALGKSYWWIVNKNLLS